MSIKPLTESQINDSLKELSGWEFKSNSLRKSFSFSDFRQALAFLVSIGFEAEELMHHPEIKNVYNRVEISLSTHDAGNKVTEKDTQLAKRIDNIAK
jgi:4a-hydroxytetrahydrobiopterin dehydratase